jgi:hypothetical protein
MFTEVAVALACVAQTGCKESLKAYESVNPEVVKSVEHRIDQITRQAPVIVKDYWFPYMLYLSGREATLSIYGPIKLHISNKNGVIYYLRDF